MRRHSASEYLKDTGFFCFGQLSQATLLKILLLVYISGQKKLHEGDCLMDLI